MKLITAVACTSLLFGGAAFAAGAAGAASPGAHSPTPHTTTTRPESSAARTEHHTKSERVARREMCTRSANNKGLKGSARTKYLHSCHLQVVPR